MLRPYRSSEATTFRAASTFKYNWRSRMVFVFGLPLLLVASLVGIGTELYGFDSRYNGVRKLVLQCIHSIYAEGTKAALDMPKPPTVTASLEIPSTYAICQEWIRRDAQGTIEPLYTQEDDTVCLDWSAPHYRLLEILGSSILDKVNGYSRYRHDCYRSRTWDEGVTGYDRTTVQQMLPVARMTPNEALFNTTEIKTQCKICLDQFDPVIEVSRVKAASFHHCFTWPSAMEGHNYTSAIVTEPGLRGDKIIVPQNASRPNTAPLTSVFKSIRNRLGYVAKIFSNVTDSPPDEHLSGVVVYLDATSIGIAKEIYPTYFPPSVTSISVLASPLCATAYLPTGQLCTTYAQELVTYFQSVYTGLTTTGFHGLNGIQFQMAASSAGLWSRMIRAKRLVCPPNSPNCLFPAASKLIDPMAGFDTYAYVLESPSGGQAIDFFTMVGHGDRATVERLPTADIPAIVAKPVVPQQYTSTGEAVAPEFSDVNKNLNAEGFKPGQTPQAAMSQTSAAQASDSSIASAAASVLPSIAANPNTYVPKTENVPDAAYVADKLAKGEPINLNYSKENTTQRATDEMVLDVDYAMVTRAYTSTVAAEQLALRKASEARIKMATQAAKAEELAAVEAGDAPPNLEMEIYCPEVTDDGYPIVIDSGTVEIYKNDKVIVSDGVGSASFVKDSLVKEFMTIPRDPITKLPYTHIYDPVTKKNITIRGTNITINTAAGTTKRDPIGILFVDNLTDPYSATLITEGGTGNLRAGNQQKKYTGTIISTGENRMDEGSVIRHGRGYAIQQRLEPGAKRTIWGWWNGFYSSESWSDSDSGGSGYDGSYTLPRRGGRSSSEDAANGGSSDSRDIGREMDNGVQPKDMATAPPLQRRTLQRGVAIQVPRDEYRRFGERRVCKNNKLKILEAQRRAREQLQTTNAGMVESVVADPAPERRHLA